jgi:hypothetical protein
MGESMRRPAEKKEVNGHGHEIHEALVRLVQAERHARQVLKSVGLLPAASGNDGHPALDSADFDGKSENAAVVPHWNSQTRELWVGKRLVKRFRVPSRAQEAILEAFHEEGWPVRIDDPLPPLTDGLPKDRLRSTIRHLNSNQHAPLVRFRGDGTGQGVLWEFVDGDGLPPTVDGVAESLDQLSGRPT